MDDAQLRRHRTATRAVVLDILDVEGELDRNHILDAWLAVRPGMGEAHRRRLPRMLDEILWRLTNLEWISATDGTYTLTDLGRRALNQRRTVP